MDIILIPGFWLDASSWSEITPPLVAAGHRVHPLTLPGMSSPSDDRRGIRLSDHVDAVVAVVDAIGGPVVLVGHSGGGDIAHAVADARPGPVARVVYVDSGPLGDGQSINDRLPVVDGEIPLPAWEEFGEEMTAGLTPELRAQFRARAVPQPARVASDPLLLSDERRYDVPITVICCEAPSTMMREWVDAGEAFVAELARVRDVEYVDLPTGHWPQFSRPADLARVVLAAVDRTL
jgi:pimeloyl-ACP methyl ester carboxylesterase